MDDTFAGAGSAKDAARAKFKASVQRGRGGRRGAGGRGGRSAPGGSSRPAESQPLEDNSWRYDEQDSGVSDVPADPSVPPTPKSQGADLAELLETAAAGTFFGRRTLRGAFELDWEDDNVRHWLGDTAQATDNNPGDEDVASLLAWDVDAVALALASLPLHELLGIPVDRAAEAAASYAKDNAVFVAAMQEARRREQPGSSDEVEGWLQTGGGRHGAAAIAPVAPHRADSHTQPLPAAASVPRSASRDVNASPPAAHVPGMSHGSALPPPAPPPQKQPPCDEEEDDDFLNEMLGKK